MKIGIFTKQIHVEKIVNFMNTTGIDYSIHTTKPETTLRDFDVGVSYCFPYIVNVNDGRPWYNYHPAPLPEYPGITNYVAAINDKVKEYGVTLHVMTDQVDCGPIIQKRTFSLYSIPGSTNELGNITHYYLFQLFKETIVYLQGKPHNEEQYYYLIGAQ